MPSSFRRSLALLCVLFFAAGADAGPSGKGSLAPPNPLAGCPEGTLKGCQAAANNALRSHDYVRAVEFYQLACDAKDTHSCVLLGLLYETGNGVKRDKDKAAALYQHACDAKDAYGCHNLGMVYDNGRGVPEDPVRAAQFFQQACDGGHGRGCYNLSLLYDEGRGVTQDKARAAKLRKRACELGVKFTCEE